MVFRFLLRVLLLFVPHLEYLGVPKYLCELLRLHPKQLQSAGAELCNRESGREPGEAPYITRTNGRCFL